MKNLAIIALLGLSFFTSCVKDRLIVADPMELAVSTLSENFICQPVALENSVVAVINNKNTTYLCNYNNVGTKTWEFDIDTYALGALSIQNVQHVDLKKDIQNNILLSMYSKLADQNQKIISQKIKVVKFSEAGQSICEISDSIHQPDTIIIQQDTINMVGKGNFVEKGTVCLIGGNYAAISTLPDAPIDSTFIQVSIYNANLRFVSNRYFRMKGQIDFIDVYSDSNNRLFWISTIKGSSVSNFLLTDLNGNLIFNIPAQGNVLDSYFFEETSGGQYVVSTSIRSSANEPRGSIVCLTKTGQGVWTNSFDFDPSSIMLSMNELSDGYIFSGFNSESDLSNIFDWRTTFTENSHRAVVLKTDFQGNEVWHKILEGNFTSASAVSIGSNPISCFGGRYEASGKNMFLIKLTEEGDLYY